MSNTDPRDMRNGWADYQRLVLSELERHSQLIGEITKILSDLRVEIALLKEDNDKIKAMQKQIDENTKIMATLQQGDAVNIEIEKYRKWLVGIILAIFLALLVPTANIVIGLMH